MPLRREPSGVVQDMALACFRWAAGAARFFLAPCRPPSTKMWEGGMERKPEAAPKRTSASPLPQEEPTEECIEPYGVRPLRYTHRRELACCIGGCLPGKAREVRAWRSCAK